MSQLAEGHVDADPLVNDINLISNALDRMQESARDRDPLERLQVYKAIGMIAGGVIEVSDILGITVEPELETPHARLAKVEAIDKDHKHSVSVDHAVTEVLEIQSPESETGTQEDLPSTELAVVVKDEVNKSAPNDDLQAIKDYFPELRLTDREAALMKNLCLKSGQKTRASDLYADLDGPGTAVKQATSKFIRKLAVSPYGQYLTVTGNKAGTRYMWQGHGFELARSESEAENYESIEVQPIILTDRTEIKIREPRPLVELAPAEEVSPETVLKKYGIETAQDGKYLTVKGVALKLSDLAVNVLQEIARHNGQTTYKELVSNKELISEQGADAARALSTVLLEISGQMELHGIAWRDVKVPGDLGKQVRKIELGNSTPLPMQPKQDAVSLTMGR